jgi:hypothetical protein
MTALMTTETIQETAAYLLQGFTSSNLGAKSQVTINYDFNKADELDTIMFSIHREICGDNFLPVAVLYDFTKELMEYLAVMDSNITDDEEAYNYLSECIHENDLNYNQLAFWLNENPHLTFSYVEDAIKEIYSYSIPEDFQFRDMVQNGLNLLKMKIAHTLIFEICSLMD